MSADRARQAERIVALLAARTSVTGGEYEQCTLCGKGITIEGRIFDELKFEDHDPECPWRLAVEWVAANPTVG